MDQHWDPLSACRGLTFGMMLSTIMWLAAINIGLSL